MKKAIIVGSAGQDGQLLTRYLLGREYQVAGITRTGVRIHPEPESTTPLSLVDEKQISSFVDAFAPNEIYYLAAHHHSSEESTDNAHSLFEQSFQTHVQGLHFFLKAIVRRKSNRIFYAASSHVFGQPTEEPQDEMTPMHPTTAYGITKLCGLHLCELYRKEHGVFASVGILYNHESPLRPEKFLSKKVVRSALRIKNRKQKELVIGNLNAIIDWGYAPEYVEAMHGILCADDANNFIIASGRRQTVKDFIQMTFDEVGLAWENHVREDETLLKRPSSALTGNPDRLWKATGWKAQSNLKDLVRLLVAAEKRRELT